MKLKALVAATLGVFAGVNPNPSVEAGVKFRNTYLFECRDKHGRLKWVEEVKNIVVNTGLDDILNKYYKGSAYTAAFYVGLKSAGSFAAADTMSSHAGWTENTNYSEAARQSLTLGAVSGQSVNNSASRATYTINATTTIAGAFVTTNSTKGGTTGTLVGGADFAAARTLSNGDTLYVTITLTAATA